MTIDSLTLNSGSGGSDLGVNTLASGKLIQYVKLLSGEDASETEQHAGHGLAANALRVELPTDGTGKVGLNTGTNSIGTVGLNTGTNSVGTVGINAGSNAIGSVEAAGAVAHDAVGTGINPTLGGAVAYEMDGTAPGTAVAEGDITRLKADRDGRQLVNISHPAAGTANDTTSSARTAEELISAPSAGFSIYITHLFCSALTAQTLSVHDEDDNILIPIQYFGADTGTVRIDISANPIKVTAAKAVEITSTAAVATTTLIQFYIAP